MVKLVFDFNIDGALQEDPFLDSYTLNYMFEQTKESMGKGIVRKLDKICCDEHGEEPTITITGRYSGDEEQMKIDYHVDTCCQMFMLRVVSMLNNIN